MSASLFLVPVTARHERIVKLAPRRIAVELLENLAENGRPLDLPSCLLLLVSHVSLSCRCFSICACMAALRRAIPLWQR